MFVHKQVDTQRDPRSSGFFHKVSGSEPPRQHMLEILIYHEKYLEERLPLRF